MCWIPSFISSFSEDQNYRRPQIAAQLHALQHTHSLGLRRPLKGAMTNPESRKDPCTKETRWIKCPNVQHLSYIRLRGLRLHKRRPIKPLF